MKKKILIVGGAISVLVGMAFILPLSQPKEKAPSRDLHLTNPPLEEKSLASNAPDYEKDCNSQNTLECINIGNMHLYGKTKEGVSFEKAQEFYMKACEQNDLDACLVWSRMQLKEFELQPPKLITKENKQKAVDFILKAMDTPYSFKFMQPYALYIYLHYLLMTARF